MARYSHNSVKLLSSEHSVVTYQKQLFKARQSSFPGPKDGKTVHCVCRNLTLVKDTFQIQPNVPHVFFRSGAGLRKIPNALCCEEHFQWLAMRPHNKIFNILFFIMQASYELSNCM